MLIFSYVVVDSVASVVPHSEQMRNDRIHRMARFPALKQPVRRERLSHARFLKLYKESPGNIARCKIVPPKLGSKNFGSVIVEYDIPVLK